MCFCRQSVSPTLLTTTHLWKNCWDTLKKIRRISDYKDNNARKGTSFHVTMGPRSVLGQDDKIPFSFEI